MRLFGASTLVLALGLIAASGAAQAGTATSSVSSAPDKDRGRAIFHRGVTADGEEIQAAMGPEGFEVAASLVPCASCHGHDGRGRPEGGIAPTDLTWPALTDPRGARQPDRRQHGPYDERSVLRAITMGVDPAGNELSDTMPRYRLSRRDAADLIAYLQHLRLEKDPGISDETLRIATLQRPGSARSQAVHTALSIYFDDLNERGGVYGRKVELEMLPLPSTEPAEVAEAVREAWGEDPPFALVGPDLTGFEEELSGLFAEERLPAIGPAALDPWLELPPNRYVFYLFGGVDELARTLVDYAGGQESTQAGRLMILHGGDDEGSTWAESAKFQAQLGSWDELVVASFGDYLAEQSQASTRTSTPQTALAGKAETVLFLGRDAELQAFLMSADAQGWYPSVLVPGLLAAPALLRASAPFQDRLYAAFPTLLTDADPKVASGYWQRAQERGLGSDHLAAQLAAVSAATLFTEGLFRSGRDLSREKLIESLEGLYDFSTGLTPEMAFTPNRRLGARGAHVVSVDLAKGTFEPTGERITPR